MFALAHERKVYLGYCTQLTAQSAQFSVRKSCFVEDYRKSQHFENFMRKETKMVVDSFSRTFS